MDLSIHKADMRAIAGSILVATLYRVAIEFAHPTHLTWFENILSFLALILPGYIGWLCRGRTPVDIRKFNLNVNIIAALFLVSLLSGTMLLLLTWNN
jgi:hypothetical protein